MSQHDYVIANQTFPNFRTDLNSAFAAIVSQNSGASAPSTTYAYQLWYDTGNDILKMRNADNDAWIELFTVDQTADTASAPSVAAGSNLIINGNMAVSQRNGTSSVTPSNSYTLDRFGTNTSQASKFTVQQDTTAPVDFVNSLKVTSSSAYSVGSGDVFTVYQNIEGQNISHLNWGSANAQTVTLSFKVRSSLTGTFGGAIVNSAQDRSYPFTYTISTADSWTDISITVAGDTSGTWLTTNGIGIRVRFNLGAGSTYSGSAGAWASANYFSATGATSVVGTSGATWYITGVQLEVGSVANPVFQHESFVETLQKCQRYFYRIGGNEPDALGLNVARMASGVMFAATTAQVIRPNPVTMRDAPNVTFDDAVANYTVMTSRTTNAVTAVGSNTSTATTMSVSLTCGATSNDGDGAVLRSTRAQSTVSVDAEL